MSFEHKIQLTNLPKILDERGNLSFVEEENHIPFKIERTYWIYDVPGGEIRGSHAFKETEEFIIALSGSFDLFLFDGTNEYKISLNRSYYGVYIPKLTWRRIENFSTNSLALVIASKGFSEDDYIRNYDEYMQYLKGVIKKKTIPFLSSNIQNNPKYIPFQTSTVTDCIVYELGKIYSYKGNITVVENNSLLPVGFQRVYYLYDLPSGVKRGGHAHKRLYQLIIAASGSFDVILNDGLETKVIKLNRPNQGLFLIPGIWREVVNFSSGSICLVLASQFYDEEDYIRDFNEFCDVKLIR